MWLFSPNIEKLETKRNVKALVKALKYHSWFTRTLAKLDPLGSDSDDDVRRHAAEALGRIGDTRAVDPLIKALECDLDDVRCRAAEALGSIGDSRAVDPLIKALGDNASEVSSKISVREAVVEALGNIGDTRAIDPLIKALGDRYEDIRKAAAEALGKIGDSRAVDPLVKAYKNDKSISSIATEALGNIGDSRAIEPIVESLLKDFENTYTSDIIIRMLGNLRNPLAVEPLIKCLNDSSYGIRHAAVEALGKIGDDRAIEPIVSALGNFRISDLTGNWGSDGSAWRAFIKVLGNFRDPRAIKPLIETLSNESEKASIRFAAGETFDKVRVEVVKTLGKIGGPLVVDPLIKALGDRAIVRSAAVKILADLGQPEWRQWVNGDNDDFNDLANSGDSRAVYPLVAGLKSYDWASRTNAAKALVKLSKKNPLFLQPCWSEISLRIRKKHYDSHEDRDNGRTSDCTWVNSHMDSGIGINFPDPPKQFRKIEKSKKADIPEESIPESPMSFTFACSHCGQHLEAENEWVGMELECPACKMDIVVKAPSSSLDDNVPLDF